MRSAPRQTDNQVLRAMAMPLVADAAEALPWDQHLVVGTSGVNYAAAKLGTQSYSAGSLTTTRN